jgi:hypothetical protein
MFIFDSDIWNSINKLIYIFSVRFMSKFIIIFIIVCFQSINLIFYMNSSISNNFRSYLMNQKIHQINTSTD